jgi:hypothetical protein
MAYNLIERPRLHAPDVVQRRNFVYGGIAYIKCGRATDTIAGPTAEWVRHGMADSEYNREPFFILHGLQEESKFVCVVHHISDSTLFVTCLQHRISLYVVFDHIWELIDPYPIDAVQAARRIRRATAIRTARTNEIQQRLTATVIVARLTEVRCYRYESEAV